MLSREEDTRWATLSHFGAIAGCFPALFIYLIYRDRGPFTAQESKEALNFSLPLTALMLFFYVIAFVPFIGGFAGLAAVAVWVFMAVSGLIAGIECNKARPYRYRFNLRLVQ